MSLCLYIYILYQVICLYMGLVSCSCLATKIATAVNGQQQQQQQQQLYGALSYLFMAVSAGVYSHRLWKTFTVGETRPISDANERKQQTQQLWIQYVAGILAREHLPPKLRLDWERRLEIQREQRRKRQGQKTTEQREHRLVQRTAIL